MIDRIDIMTLKKTLSLYIGVASIFFAAPALAGDVAAGEKVFKKCKACHVVEEKHKTGPHLVNLFGRTAGTAEGQRARAQQTLRLRSTIPARAGAGAPASF